ncbi:MAG: DUF401 family protein [Candidatus Methanomethylicia archaeon]
MLSIDVLLLLLSMIIVIVLSYRQVNIGLSAIVGAAILCFSFLPFFDALMLLFKSIIDLRTIEVTLTVTFITILGFLMQKLNIISRLMNGLKSILGDIRLIMIIGPALLGMLPTYGGALFSAPIVDIAGSHVNINSRMKTFINVWFRHVIFFIYPLTPAIVMISGLTGISILSIIMYMAPIFIISIVLGYMFSMRGIKRFRIDRSKNMFKDFLVCTSPILIVVLLTFLLNIPRYLPVLAGIIISLIIGRGGINDLKHVIFRCGLQNFILATLGLMVFSITISSLNVSISIAKALSILGIPEYVIGIVLPIIIGFITGSPLTSIGLSIPIVQGITTLTSANVSLIYAGSVLGYLASPLHLCLVLSSEYYKVKLTDTYTYIVPAIIILAFSSMATIIYLANYI